MSRIFLSHSSVDEHEAIALKQWLADNGWDDVFLDVDPERGLVAGDRWQEAIRKAADHCEAVVFVVSPAWAKSKWCLAEFLLAKSLRKLIFGVMLKDVAVKELPLEMTSEWQLCRLMGNGPMEWIHLTHDETPGEVAFLADGLKRLKDGLQKAGLRADFFPWPPKDDPNRGPYRGLEPLESCDAAVFFGRDVEILRGLEALRGMRDKGDKKLFVILGASGAGKSSFLRAGLLPRLARDDRHFLPLPVIRPERDPMFGERGLAYALHGLFAELRLPLTNLGDIKARLSACSGGLVGLLSEAQQAARSRLITSAESPPPPTPTIILSVDQAEELFTTDAGEPARNFLRLIGTVLLTEDHNNRSGNSVLPLIVVFTIRSDRYEPLQTAPDLAGLQSVVFDDLKPMPPTRFRDVIIGPAQRASTHGRNLDIKPDLVERLVEECAAGGDALPLLGLTLARLYRDYGSDGDLRLDEYQEMGGLAMVVKTEAESILSADEGVRRDELAQLRAAFIPWLATINPQNNQPMRRIARRCDLPAKSLDLVDALAEKRLLLTDLRAGQKVIEVAHESLFRHWDVLAKWLEVHRADLKDADLLERQVLDWNESGKKEAWLWGGERLSNAEALATKPGFRDRLDSCREFLLASRHTENIQRAAEELRRQAELAAAKELAAEHAARADAEERAKIAALASAALIRRRSIALGVALMLVIGTLGSALWLYANGLTFQHGIAMAKSAIGLYPALEPDIVWLPAGEFFMGSGADDPEAGADEKPQHRVVIGKPFALGRKEVTFEEYDRFVYATRRKVPEDQGWGRGRRPVINVSWNDASAYADWLRAKTGKPYRLPSEAEWEYAARAGKTTWRFWGDSPELACRYANVADLSYAKQYGGEKIHHCDDRHAVTAEVGKFEANAFGLYDIIGNVWEWVQDCKSSYADAPPTDGSAQLAGDCTLRIRRGGSRESEPYNARSARRLWNYPGSQNDRIGFRLAQD